MYIFVQNGITEVYNFLHYRLKLVDGILPSDFPRFVECPTSTSLYRTHRLVSILKHVFVINKFMTLSALSF